MFVEAAVFQAQAFEGSDGIRKMDAVKSMRVLDLTDELGAYSTKLLADLGAEVIRVDPVDGGLLDRPPYLDDANKISLFDIFFNQ